MKKKALYDVVSYFPGYKEVDPLPCWSFPLQWVSFALIYSWSTFLPTFAGLKMLRLKERP